MLEPAARTPEQPATADTPQARVPLFLERRSRSRAAGRTPPAVEPAARNRRRPDALWLAAGLALVGASASAGSWAFGLAAALVALVALVAVQARRNVALHARADSLHKLARVDELTGLGNTRALWDALPGIVDGAAANGQALSVAMLDFDNFKLVNERFGHPVGDALLRRASQAVREQVPPPGVCYRYGGEELLLVLPGQDEEAAGRTAEAVRAAVAALDVKLPHATVSGGAAELAPLRTAWELVESADRALRTAKAEGRNRVVRAGTLGAVVPEEAAVAARRAAMAMATAALAARDGATADHSDDVVELAEAIAERLGIDGHERDVLLAAARLHDVGKLAIPAEILEKPAPLDEEEWALMQRHTVIGQEILQSVAEMQEVATVVRHSHEHFDGNGYPDGISGDAIPMASRIILCADAFHAIRSDRPYRQGRPPGAAFAEIQRCSGTQFDPQVVDALEGIWGEAQSKRRGSPRLVALLLTAVLSGTAVAAPAPLRHAFEGLTGGGSKSASAPSSRPAGLPLASCAHLSLSGHPCTARAAALGPVAVAVRRAGESASSTADSAAARSAPGAPPVVTLPSTDSPTSTSTDQRPEDDSDSILASPSGGDDAGPAVAPGDGARGGAKDPDRGRSKDDRQAAKDEQGSAKENKAEEKAAAKNDKAEEKADEKAAAKENKAGEKAAKEDKAQEQAIKGSAKNVTGEPDAGQPAAAAPELTPAAPSVPTPALGPWNAHAGNGPAQGDGGGNNGGNGNANAGGGKKDKG